MSHKPHETIWPTPVRERGCCTIEFVLQDEDGISPPSLDALTLTLYNRPTGAVINGKDNASILNTANGTYTYAGGVGTVRLALQSADLALEVADASQEIHVALFRYSWGGGGAKDDWHRVILTVAGERKVP